ncbi:hypothetical protein BW13_02000 [Bifidobacterium sp. UTCIF-37]|uniref:hypothetical protein n=1 Tax=unclassified Bifidobacterium TaxID=2608897 RepID=UPI0021590D01|nr:MULTISPECIES: hypothetical protein [unclassified Bifidobacterium]TPF87043.1 hypothetical protein BW13_02000 [Bifidobacterium sp. UTCIF-37]
MSKSSIRPKNRPQSGRNARVPSSGSHARLFVVVVAAVVAIILAFLSAFVWPGWALNKDVAPKADQSQSAEPTTPSIKAEALPSDATELLKAMPDSVLNFARTKAEDSTTWSSSSPLEEYTLTYSTGKKTENVTLVVAQWSTSTPAKTQYDALAKALGGKTIASGSVKVQGSSTGDYVVKGGAEDGAQATAVWRNDTVVFQATGAKSSVQRFYQKFPL